jgi:hypothetical protein
VQEAANLQLGGNVGDSHGYLAQNLHESGQMGCLGKKNAYADIANAIDCDIDRMRANRLQQVGAHVKLEGRDVQKPDQPDFPVWDTQYTRTGEVERQKNGQVDIKRAPKKTFQNENDKSHDKLTEIRQPGKLTKPKKPSFELDDNYFAKLQSPEIQEFSTYDPDPKEHTDYRACKYPVVNNATPGGYNGHFVEQPDPSRTKPEEDDEEPEEDDEEAKIVRELLYCMAREAGLNVSDYSVRKMVQEEMAENNDEDEDEDENRELCRFCKPKGSPCCFKCLVGKSSKKIRNFGNNIHGFAP